MLVRSAILQQYTPSIHVDRDLFSAADLQAPGDEVDRMVQFHDRPRRTTILLLGWASRFAMGEIYLWLAIPFEMIHQRSLTIAVHN